MTVKMIRSEPGQGENGDFAVKHCVWHLLAEIIDVGW